MNDNDSFAVLRPVIITRPIRAARRTADRLRAAGASGAGIVISPLLKITKTASLPDLKGSGAVIFTSENGVFAAPPLPIGMTAWCVGTRTAAAARSRGFAAIAGGGSAESLIALLCENRPAEPLAWLRGEHAAVDIAARLAVYGLQVRSEIVYRQSALPLSEEAARLLRAVPCVLPVYSPRTAALLSAEAAVLPDPGHTILCLSGRVRDACGRVWKTEVACDAGGLIAMTVRAALRPAAGS